MNKKIEFKQCKGTPLFTAATETGNVVSYNFIHEDRIIHYIKKSEPNTELEAEKVKGAKVWTETKKPTKMYIASNFKFTGEMLDLMEQSKIMEVIGRVYHEDTSTYEVTYYPRIGFEYDKLQDVIVDILEKFNL